MEIAMEKGVREPTGIPEALRKHRTSVLSWTPMTTLDDLGKHMEGDNPGQRRQLYATLALLLLVLLVVVFLIGWWVSYVFPFFHGSDKKGSLTPGARKSSETRNDESSPGPINTDSTANEGDLVDNGGTQEESTAGSFDELTVRRNVTANITVLSELTPRGSVPAVS